MSTRQDLINVVASKNIDIPKDDIEMAVTAVFSYLENGLLNKNRVEIRHFGSFSIRNRKFSSRSSLKKQEDNVASVRNINVVYYRMAQAIFSCINK